MPDPAAVYPRIGRLNVVTGANGVGKSNLYKALRLLADAAQGGVIAMLAREGGLAIVRRRMDIMMRHH